MNDEGAISVPHLQKQFCHANISSSRSISFEWCDSVYVQNGIRNTILKPYFHHKVVRRIQTQLDRLVPIMRRSFVPKRIRLLKSWSYFSFKTPVFHSFRLVIARCYNLNLSTRGSNLNTSSLPNARRTGLETFSAQPLNKRSSDTRISQSFWSNRTELLNSPLSKQKQKQKTKQNKKHCAYTNLIYYFLNEGIMSCQMEWTRVCRQFSNAFMNCPTATVLKNNIQKDSN